MCVPLSRIQRLIGARMLSSKQNKPCFYLATRADVTELMALRHGLSKTLGVKVTSNAFFIRALALAATQYPLMVGRLVPWEAGGCVEGVPSTGSGQAPPSDRGHELAPAEAEDVFDTRAVWNRGQDDRDTGMLSNRGQACPEFAERDVRDTMGGGSEPQDSLPTEVIRIAEHVNVGFAVNSAQGLVVPVVKQAQIKSLAKIAGEEKALTNKARINRLTLDDLEGESIALSNLGAFDIDSFLGIVPLQVSAILTAGKVALVAVPWNGRAIPRKMVSLSLAVDGRVIDPPYAARFLQLLTEKLEDPERLV